jgi:BlaI family transcriptional regulator, penicillinase repressor
MLQRKSTPEPPLLLTRAEEEVMQVLWEIEKGMVHDLLERFPDPKPAYNTVSTIIRILEQKGFAGHKAYGRTHEYFPLVSKEEYSRSSLRSLIRNYFGNSYGTLASFFAKGENLSLKELEEIRQVIGEEIRKQQEEKP